MDALPIRNPGTPLYLEWIRGLRVDARRARAEAEAIEVRTTDRTDRVPRILRAVRLLDLTTLNDDDTEATVRALCARALRPLPPELAAAVGAEGERTCVAAVCVFDRFVRVARSALDDEGGVRVAAVTAGFPHPHAELDRRLAEVRAAVEAGAHEIDAVITRQHALRHDWPALYEEVRSLREASGSAMLKTILAAGDLGSLDAVAGAGLVCCMAGADFIKTSTGREEVNATLPIGLAMSAAIRRYRERAGHDVGLKAAGGIRRTDQALAWLRLAEEQLPGGAPPTAARFRIGASSLLGDIVETLAAQSGG